MEHVSCKLQLHTCVLTSRCAACITWSLPLKGSLSTSFGTAAQMNWNVYEAGRAVGLLAAGGGAGACEWRGSHWSASTQTKHLACVASKLFLCSRGHPRKASFPLYFSIFTIPCHLLSTLCFSTLACFIHQLVQNSTAKKTLFCGERHRCENMRRGKLPSGCLNSH